MAPVIRIALRVLAGYLAARGLPEDVADMLWMDQQLVAGITLVVTEGWYLMAKRWGWAK